MDGAEHPATGSAARLPHSLALRLPRAARRDPHPGTRRRRLRRRRSGHRPLGHTPSGSGQRVGLSRTRAERTGPHAGQLDRATVVPVARSNDGHSRPLRDLARSTVEIHTVRGRRFASRRSGWLARATSRATSLGNLRSVGSTSGSAANVLLLLSKTCPAAVKYPGAYGHCSASLTEDRTTIVATGTVFPGAGLCAQTRQFESST